MPSNPEQSPFFPSNNRPPEKPKPDPELEAMLAVWKARGKKKKEPVKKWTETDRLVRDSELRQLQEMRRAGIGNVDELPGENN